MAKAAVLHPALYTIALNDCSQRGKGQILHEDDAEVSNLAPVVFCADMGYAHLFKPVDLQQAEPFTWERFSETFTRVIARGAQ